MNTQKRMSAEAEVWAAAVEAAKMTAARILRRPNAAVSESSAAEMAAEDVAEARAKAAVKMAKVK